MSLCGNNNPCPDLITGQKCGITYTGARYVPLFADPAEWDNTKTYEPLTIVLNEGNSYTSKTFVPIGIDINNTDFWAQTGNYNAQVEAYRQEVVKLKDSLSKMFALVDTSMTQEQIQNIIINNRYVKFLDGTYNFDIINGIALGIPSNSYIFFQNAVITINPTSLNNYQILDIKQATNITLCGNLQIIGDRLQHPGSTGEWGFGISIQSSSNITINNVSISNCWGDGIYIGESINQTNENIVIENVTLTNNRRQGISIISVDELYINNCYITNTNGTDPQYGIDFEPNFNYQKLKNVKINNLTTDGNTGGGILFQLAKFDNTTDDISIDINSHISKNEMRALNLSTLTTTVKGSIKINNSQVYWNSQNCPVLIANGQTINLELNDYTIYIGSDIRASDPHYGSPIEVLALTKSAYQGIVGNFTFNNLTLNNNSIYNIVYAVNQINPNNIDGIVFNNTNLNCNVTGGYYIPVAMNKSSMKNLNIFNKNITSNNYPVNQAFPDIIDFTGITGNRTVNLNNVYKNYEVIILNPTNYTVTISTEGTILGSAEKTKIMNANTAVKILCIGNNTIIVTDL